MELLTQTHLGVAVAVVALVACAFDAAVAAAGAIAEGVAQVAVEVHDGLEGQAFVDFEQVGDQGFFGAHSGSSCGVACIGGHPNRSGHSDHLSQVPCIP